MCQGLMLSNATCDLCCELVPLARTCSGAGVLQVAMRVEGTTDAHEPGKDGLWNHKKKKKRKKKERKNLSKYTGLNKGQLMSEHGDPRLWSSPRPG
jgi:hypothetical protein